MTDAATPTELGPVMPAVAALVAEHRPRVDRAIASIRDALARGGSAGQRRPLVTPMGILEISTSKTGPMVVRLEIEPPADTGQIYATKVIGNTVIIDRAPFDGFPDTVLTALVGRPFSALADWPDPFLASIGTLAITGVELTGSYLRVELDAQEGD